MDFFYLVLIMLFLLLLSQWRSHKAIKTELKKGNSIAVQTLKETRATRKKIDEHISTNTRKASELTESLEESRNRSSDS